MPYIPGIGYIGSPQDLLQNEWILFALIFLLSYSIVYFSLSKFFSTKEKASFEDLLRGKKDKLVTHPTAAIVSLIFAIFSASSLSRSGPLFELFGTILVAWDFLLVLIVMFLIALPFFRAVNANFAGSKLASIFSGVLAGVGFWFALKSTLFYNQFGYSFTSWSYDAYGFLISPLGLFIMIIFFIFTAIFTPSTKVRP